MATTQSASRQKWEGRWEQLVGRAKKLWGKVTNDDLMQAEGDYERLVGIIHEKTGQTRLEIEKSLNED